MSTGRKRRSEILGQEGVRCVASNNFDKSAERFFSLHSNSEEREKTKMKMSAYKSYDDLPLFLNAAMVAQVLGKLVTTDLDRERFYMDYVNTYLEGDIRGLALVGKLGAFYDFLVYKFADRRKNS